MNATPKKILIVEDDVVTQKLYSDVLTNEGFVVDQAYDGKQGLSIIKSSHPDLVILDLMLPGGVNGFDILETMKADPALKSIPVLIFTNLDTEQKTAMTIGANDYIIKSNISVQGLVEKVKQHLQ